MGLKKKGFGQGLWNGFGGKVEKGETIEHAAVREVQEEAGITPLGLKKRGKIDFYQFNGEVFEVHFFTATSFSGTPKEWEKLIPKWFDETEIPYDKMFPDDKIWLPMLLGGQKFSGEVWFDKDYKIVKHTIRAI